MYFRAVEIALQKRILMNKIFPVFIGLLSIASCTRPEPFRIDGTVPGTTFEGSKIYLVALDGPVSKNVDSSFIRNGKFLFEKKADSMGVKILRVPARFPDVVEDLVVITEPGNLEVVMSSNSHGHGTRLNNILQEWKNRKHINDSLQRDLYFRKNMEGVTQAVSDSLLRYSRELNTDFMGVVVKLMNENLDNGIGLLLFKVYYHTLPAEVKERVLELTGDTYLEKDKELKRIVMYDQNNMQ